MKRILLSAVLIFSGIFLSCSREEPFVAPEPVVETVKINEVYSNGDDINPDWIEIYNTGNTEVNISGYKIYDSGAITGTNPKPKKLFPSGTLIPAGGFYVITVDDTTESGFGLSSNGETVWLENPSGVVVDSLVFSATDSTQSFGRYPDGSANISLLLTITRGSANIAENQSNVVINEIYSRGIAGDPDWIEIYNSTTSSVDLTGYKIYDNGGQSGSKTKKEFPAGTIVPAGEYFVIVVDDSDPSGFGLSSSGEQVWLEKANGSIIDSVTFPALGIDSSYARVPNGSPNWEIIYPATKGGPNLTASQPLVMNEFFSRGADPDFDWIEIYNPNPVQVELTGYKIYDGGGNLGTKPKMEFPVGAVVPANGFYVIVVDVQDAAGFGLGSGGDECWLENSSGTVIDNQVIPAMPVATTSYSRVPDGSTNWLISNTITKGAPNQP